MIQKLKLIFFCILLLSGFEIKASHIFGGELTYRNVAGNTYEITLTLYGDCSGNAFPNLPGSIPTISIYNAQSLYTSINLFPFGIVGEEVTPVCPSEINNTACKGGPIPGVARFIFKNTVTLNQVSANWRFVFDGTLGANNYSGRSHAITNISQGVNASIMQLIATLNNVNGPNNSSSYTTIPTPFFCINTSQQYNQGAIDLDGDGLSFSLIPGLDANNNNNVTYIPPFTFSEPLAVAPGSFNFNSGTGQLSFYPNAVQNSLVVSKVVETRNGVVVGSSMREMTFVVLNNCNNQSPSGSISGNNAGTLINGTEISICNADQFLSFNILATDPDNGNINVTYNGLPAGANIAINNNNTTSPGINFTWNIPANLPLGDYTFYITFQDDGCPLSSKQTMAYTIHYVQPISAAVVSVAESCSPSNDGSVVVNASGANGGFFYSLNGAGFQNNNTFPGLSAGTYTVVVKDNKNCTLSTQVAVSGPIYPDITELVSHDIKCFGGSDGIIEVKVSPSNPNYFYHLMPGNIINSTGIFDNLAENTYTVVVDDNRGCTDTASTSIAEPIAFEFGNIEITPLSCNKTNGKILVQTNFDNQISYKLIPTSFAVNSTGLFENLSSGFYTIVARNTNNCTIDTVVYVDVLPPSFFISTTQKDLPCNGTGTEGEAEVLLTGGEEPISILWGTSPPQTGAIAANLYYGWYFVSATDATGCEVKDTVYIKPGNCCENIFLPTAFSPNYDSKNDEWKMVTSTGMEIVQFAIFDRWGQKVWLARDQRDSWNGKMGNGDAEMGTYFYLLRYKCLSDGKQYTKSGDFLLVR